MVGNDTRPHASDGCSAAAGKLVNRRPQGTKEHRWADSLASQCEQGMVNYWRGPGTGRLLTNCARFPMAPMTTRLMLLGRISGHRSAP